MSAAVAAALKKIAVSLLTNPKVLKTIGGIVLGILILFIMPLVAVLSIFDGDIEMDNTELQQTFVQNLSAEEQENLQCIEDTMYAIEDEMADKGFAARTKEAHVLYVLSLSDYAYEQDFVSKLTGCFTAGQSDTELIAAVNEAFGTQLAAADFSKVMNSIRGSMIDISAYTDPQTKNHLDLVTWAKNAVKNGWGYVYGTYGEVLDQSLYAFKLNQYPQEVGRWSETIEQNWLGKRTADCVGLIKGYGWLNPDTRRVGYGINGMPDINADAMYQYAREKGSIDTIPEIPGLAVWHEGHIGIYIGGGEVIEAKGTQYGVVQTQLSSGGWTHWLKIPYITYLEAEE